MITTHREAVMCVKYNRSFKHVITASENSVSIKTLTDCSLGIQLILFPEVKPRETDIRGKQN